jgi:DNA-binding PadR family transcriptional regulator
MSLAKGLVAASATPLILSILSHGDSYGYAIIGEVRQLSGGEMEWTDGMLYPILHRLEKRQQIESYWGTSENGRKRKYYRLRESGLRELTEQRNHWTKLHAMLMKLQGGKVCFD